MAKVKLNISKEDFLEQLRIKVELKREFVSHFDRSIDKPYFGTLTDEHFEIRNTPRFFNVPTMKIIGIIGEHELSYKVIKPFRKVMLILTIVFLVGAVLLSLLNLFEFGLQLIGLTIFINGLTFIPFAINKHQFEKWMYEVNGSG